MSDKLFYRSFLWALTAITGAEILSFLTISQPQLNSLIFWLIIVLTALTAVYKLDLALLLVIGELTVGGKGYLFSIDILGHLVSVRIGIFIIVVFAWCLKIISDREVKQQLWSKIQNNRALFVTYLSLFFFIGIGIINGIVQNSKSNTFFDLNAWFYFGLLGLFLSLNYQTKLIKKIFGVVAGGTLLLSLKTILLLFLFSHDLAKIGDYTYQWVRLSGAGEITYISGSLFRIFFQSQIYSLFALVLFFSLFFTPLARNKNAVAGFLYLYLVALSILISQSRSFWVGAIFAFPIVALIAVRANNLRIKQTLITISVTIVTICSLVYSLQFISGNFGANPLTDRFKNIESEPASATRLQELNPLLTAIKKYPFIGYGFGKTLTYISDDPRIRQINPSGEFTTYAFEWGYLDIWLKLGIFGLLSYLSLLAALLIKIWQRLKTNSIIAPGFFAAIVALLATNMFSPYLNHPLGISFILLATAIFTNKKTDQARSI